ncbi:MAG TPA: hypothetical protein VH643_24305 [Gemmataceae bacterium]|jgi:hypothetical protein
MSAVIDRVAKWAASRGSRRDALRYLAGFLGGGFLMGSLSGCGKNGQISQFCLNYCAACKGVSGGAYGNCIQNCEICKFTGGSPCPSAALSTCTSSTVVTCCYGDASCCATSSGTPYCSDLNFDPQNCSACGSICSGQTTPGCCKGTCVDLDSDINHCGKCRKACTSGTTPACCSGKCVDTDSDPNNCGSCGNVCASGQTCSGGSCS